ncbi:MAG: hypothetical protein PHC51_10520 [bacterium]|nr:hypothetical protein [bacterium]
MAKDDNSQSSGGSHLSTTADVFSTRIQRRKKEHAEQEDAKQQQDHERHAQMLDVMSSIRRSLQDIVHINLGQSFFFNLNVDDFEGWPRLTVQLRSAMRDPGDLPVLQISAHDRHSLGTIQIFDSANQIQNRLSIEEPGAGKKLPSLLRKMCREYLDRVTELILQLEKKEQQALAALDSQISLPEVTMEALAERKHGHISADFISDALPGQTDFEQLATLDEVELLSIPDYDQPAEAGAGVKKPK